MNTILVVDDDEYIGNVLEEVLINNGYRVLRAYSGTEAVLVLSKNKPDVIILDLMLPGLNGEDVLQYTNGIPVIVLSAKIDIDNKVKLLLDGAADYITKPFNTKELLARIAVQLRNSACAGNTENLKFNELSLCVDAHIASVNSREVRLTRTEFAILKLLMQNQTRVITKTQILDSISDDTPDCSESSLKIHISNLRKKLREISGKDYIESVWGIGFKLAAQ